MADLISAQGPNNLNNMVNGAMLQGGQDPFGLNNQSSDQLGQFLQLAQQGLGNIQKQPSYVDLFNQSRQNAGIPQLQKQFTDITSQLQGLNQSYTTALGKINQTPDLTGFQMGAREQALSRSANPQIGQLEAQRNVLGQQLGFANEQAQGQFGASQAESQRQLQLAGLPLDFLGKAFGLQKEQAQAQAARFKEIPFMGGLYDLKTGQQVAGGVSPEDQQLLNKAIEEHRFDPSTQITRYNLPSIMSTLRQDPGYDFVGNKASAAGQVAGATAKSQLHFNPITGEPIQFQPTVPGTKTLRGQTGTPTTQTGTTVPTGGSNTGFVPPTPKTKVQADFLKDYNTGTIGKQVNSLNTALGHLFEADDRFNDLKNSNIPVYNTVKNLLATQTGKAAAKKYGQAIQLFQNELAKGYGADAEGDRRQLQGFGSASESPAQHKGYLNTVATLLGSKIRAFADQYQRAMGQPLNSLDGIISPENQRGLQARGIDLKELAGNIPITGASAQAPRTGQTSRGIKFRVL